MQNNSRWGSIPAQIAAGRKRNLLVYLVLPPSTVVAGLDPAIQPACEIRCIHADFLYRRVKPGGDDVVWRRRAPLPRLSSSGLTGHQWANPGDDSLGLGV
jgi:hypothetical protein